MMYPFLTLDDNTEIVHSEMRPDGRVKVYFENRMKRTAFTPLSAISPATNGRRSPGSRRRSCVAIKRS